VRPSDSIDKGKIVNLAVGVCCQESGMNLVWCLKHLFLANPNLLRRDNLLCRVDAPQAELGYLVPFQKFINRITGLKKLYFGVCITRIREDITTQFGTVCGDVFYNIYSKVTCEARLKTASAIYQRRYPREYKYLLDRFGEKFCLFTNTISTTGEVCSYCSLSSHAELDTNHVAPNRAWADMMKATVSDFLNDPNMSAEERGNIGNELNRIVSANQVRSQQLEATPQGPLTFTVRSKKKNELDQMIHTVKLPSDSPALNSTEEQRIAFERSLREYDMEPPLEQLLVPSLNGSQMYCSFGTCTCGSPRPILLALLVLICVPYLL